MGSIAGAPFLLMLWGVWVVPLLHNSDPFGEGAHPALV